MEAWGVRGWARADVCMMYADGGMEMGGVMAVGWRAMC
jgi:hypothetical protein